MNPFAEHAPTPTRSQETQAQYEKRARTWLRRIDPGLPLPEALVEIAAHGSLCGATKRMYRAVCHTVIDICVAEGRITQEEGDTILLRMVEVVTTAKRPGVKRTSRRKQLDFDARDHRDVVRELERRENAKGDRSIARCASLFTMILPFLGCRPHEVWSIAIIERDVLRIPTCKTTNNRSDGPWRDISIRTFPHPLRRSIAEFVQLVARLRAFGYDQQKLERAVAARLARASTAVLGRIMCPYALRHIAIAIWRNAGLGDEAIRALLGHRSRLTARRWYARLGKGWRWRGRFPVPLPLQPHPAADPPTAEPDDVAFLSPAGFP